MWANYRLFMSSARAGRAIRSLLALGESRLYWLVSITVAFTVATVVFCSAALADEICPNPVYNPATNTVEVAFIRDNYRELFLRRNPDGTRTLSYKMTEPNGMSTAGAASWSAPFWDYDRIEQWAWNPRTKQYIMNGRGDALSRDLVEMGIVSLADRDIYLLVPGLTGDSTIGLRLEIVYDAAGRVASISSTCGDYWVWDELFNTRDEYSELYFDMGFSDGTNIDLPVHILCVGGRVVANNNYSCRVPKKLPTIKPSRGLSNSALKSIKPHLEVLRRAVLAETSSRKAAQHFKTMQALLNQTKRLVHSSDLLRFNAVQYYVKKGTVKSPKLATLRTLATQLEPFISTLSETNS